MKCFKCGLFGPFKVIFNESAHEVTRFMCASCLAKVDKRITKITVANDTNQ